MSRVLVPLLAATSLVAAAGGSTEAASDTTEPSEGGGDAVTADVERAPVDPDAPVDVAVRGSNNAALAMLRAQYEGQDVVLGPVSVTTAFAMAAEGADDATRADLATVFGFPEGDELGSSMNALTDALVPDEVPEGMEQPVFELANTTWAQEGAEIGDAFLETLAAQYGAGVQTVDFTDAEATREAINAWIAERTHDRIPQLIAAPGLPVDTMFALANAVYFKGAWLHSFPEESTAPGPFTTADGTVVEAEMMAQELTTSFVYDEDVHAVHLPFAGDEFVMTIAMPDDVTEFLADADGESWSMLTDAATSGPVDLVMPKWEASTTADLAPTLSELGLPIPGGSYPGIMSDATIGSVVHGADIAVDELGAEAAAATLIAMPTSAPVPEEQVSITIDQPFVYSITHVPTGTILFIGVETDPSA